jgi:hypothetical protein
MGDYDARFPQFEKLLLSSPSPTHRRGGAGLRSTIVSSLESLALMESSLRLRGRVARPRQNRFDGHSGTHSAVDALPWVDHEHVRPSRKQSTGHTSTQSVYLHLMQLSVTTYAIVRTSPPGPNDSRTFRRIAGHFITHGPGHRHFVLKK